MKATVSGIIVMAGMLIAQMGWGQTTPMSKYGLGQGEMPATELLLSFDTLHVNAPPKECGCFWMYGGSGGAVLNFTRHWSGVVDLTSAHAGTINGTNEYLTIFNYQVGPRYSFRSRSRWTIYGQALLGGSEVFSNYSVYGTGGRSYFSSTVGSGVVARLSDHIGLTMAEASWAFSQATNGVNSRQNNMRLGSGVIFRFLPR